MALEETLPAPGICESCKRKPCVKIFADTSGLAGHPIAIHAADGVPSQCPAELRAVDSIRIWRVSSLSMSPLAVSGTPGSRVLYPDWTSPIAGRIRALTQILRPKANTAAKSKGRTLGAEAQEEGAETSPEEIKPTLTNCGWVFLAQPKSPEGEERSLASAAPLDFVWCKVDTEGLMPGDTISFTVFLKGKEGQEDIKISTVTGRVGENRKDESAVAKFQIPQDVAGKALIPDSDRLYFLAKQFAEAIEVKSALLPVAPPPPLVLAVETLPSVTFAHDSSALAPAQKSRLVQLRKSMDEWFAKHPDGHVALFGHADLTGDEAYNKTLSERRAASVLATITHDAAAWEGLYQKEAWSLLYVQELLLALDFDPGPLDGVSGPKTEAAIEAFQKSEGLSESGQNDAGLRKALFTAYFKAAFEKPIASSCLQSINGHAFAGCSEFNPVEDTQAASVVNRRVTVVLLDPKADSQLVFPCASGDIKPCKQQMGKNKPQRHCATFKCCFYDELVRQEKNEGEVKGELILPDYDPGMVVKAEPSGCAGEGNELPKEIESGIVKCFLHSKENSLKRFVNIKDGSKEGMIFELEAEVEGNVRTVYWKAKAGKGNSKRNDPPPGWIPANTDIVTPLKDGVGEWECEVLDGKAKARFCLGLAGGDEFTFEVGTEKGKPDLVQKTINWRRLWYQLTHHKSITPPSMATAELKLKEVFIDWVADPVVEHEKSPAGKVIVGSHNASEYHQLLKSPHMDQCAHIILCDMQYDGIRRNGSNYTSVKTKNFKNTKEIIDMNDDDKNLEVLVPPVQKGAKLFVKGVWKSSKSGKSGNLTDDDTKKNDDTGFVEWVANGEFKVSLPKNADLDKTHPVLVSLEVTAANGPWGGDGGTAPHNLIVIDSSNTIHSQCVIHELGHIMNMVPLSGYYKAPPGLTLNDHAASYSGMGGAGSHCSWQTDQSLDTAEEFHDGKCIMFHQLNYNCKLVFCPNCAPFVKAQALFKFKELKE